MVLKVWLWPMTILLFGANFFPKMIVSGTNCNSPIIAGTTTIEVNGLEEEKTVLVTDWNVNKTTRVEKKTIFVGHSSRVFLGERCEKSFSRDIFTKFFLFGRQIRFLVDLSRVGCACNAAAFLVSMPACRKGRVGDFYCDANGVDGTFCPEIDLMEANNAVFVTTSHGCASHPRLCVWENCDQNGTGYRFYPRWNAIDRGSPFNVTNQFIVQKEKLVNIRTILSQGDVKLVHNNLHKDHLSQLTPDLKSGMVLVFAFWGDKGSESAWLDAPPCDMRVNCDGSNPVPISNIWINSL